MKKNIDFISYLRKYEILLAAVTVLILVIFLVFTMLLPNLNRANQIYAQKQLLQKKLENLKQKDAMLSSLDYQYYKDIFLKSSQVLPENKDYVSLIGTFDLLEKQSGVSVVRTDFQLGVVSTSSANLTRAVGSAAYVVPITIEVMGDLAGLGKFLDAVANYTGRLMVFDDMSVGSKPGEVLDATFTGKAFFYILPATLGPLDSSLTRLEKNEEAILTKISQMSLPAESSTELDKSSIGKKNLFQ